MERVKGFQDFLGQDAKKRERMLELIKDQFNLFGFEPAETPIVEYEEFVRGKNTNDEAVRDVFSLEDRGKRKLALRFEFTFQLKRIAKNQKLPYRRYQIGYVFRDEPIRQGRLRQFIQCDADIIGSNTKDEAECLTLAQKICEKLEIPCTIYINNRKLINEILDKEKISEEDREQIIRELDKLDKLSKKEVEQNLKPFKAEKLVKLFTSEEKSFEKYSSFEEIKKIKQLCKDFKIKVEFRPFLARGLSYYNGTVFEIWSKELNVALTAGGSYLNEGIQSTGISFGLEPLSLLSKIESEKNEILIVSLNQDKKAIEIAEKLRNKGTPVILLTEKSPSKALDYANSKQIPKVLIIGENEVKSGKLKVKDMKSGKETELKI
jgi:histidyl-tRNA synthetase